MSDFDVSAKRKILADLAAMARQDQLETIAQAHDLLDVVEAIDGDGAISPETAELLGAMHRRFVPGARITWNTLDSANLGRGWTIHPADMTEEKLNDMRPIPVAVVAGATSATERLWLHTSGDPDNPSYDAVGIMFGAYMHGSVMVGFVATSDSDQDDPAARVAIATSALAMSTRAARLLRDNLNKAIRHADQRRAQHLAMVGRVVRDRIIAQGLDEVTAGAVADAVIESANTDGLPQVVALPDGGAVTVSVNGDGEIDIDLPPSHKGGA